MTPEWKLQLRFDDGHVEQFNGLNLKVEQIAGLIYEISLPMLVTGKFIDVQINSQQIEIKGGSLYGLVLETPLLVDEKKARVSFNKETRQLRLKIKKLKQQEALQVENEEE